MSELVRFGVSLEQDLLEAFDSLCERRESKRSEAIRHCIRRELAEEVLTDPNASVAGVLTLMFDHHDSDLPGRLTSLQHEAHDMVIATMHVHLDEHRCLEAMALRGSAAEVSRLADKLRSARGVLQSSCSLTAIESVHEHGHQHCTEEKQ
ncbi:MAG: nickel-responsive transcriptional regulator NikR [Mailhella sp.]|nr:nickel-responsive transcriptional regulator NikR [Mailhella sp.]